jgi:hypothetical protein
LTETHVATFVYSNVAGKRFAKVGVKAFLVAAGATASKCDRM